MSDISCPECKHIFNVEAKAMIGNEHRLSFVIAPKSGDLLMAKTIGKSVDNMANLMDAVAKDIGAKTKTFVERISTGDDGSMRFDLLIMRVDS